jgi:hypothetical protein
MELISLEEVKDIPAPKEVGAFSKIKGWFSSKP